MHRLCLLLMAGLLVGACGSTPTDPLIAPAEFLQSVGLSSACHPVSGTLVLKFVGSDGTRFFFEGEVHGDLEGTVAQAITIDEPIESLPHVVHISGTGEWTIISSTAPDLDGRVLSFMLKGIAVSIGADDLGHAFHATLVGGASSGNIVSQEPQSGFVSYRGQICS